MNSFVLATNNNHKAKEFKELFPSIQILTLKEANVVSNPEENGTTFLENARIKAIAASLLVDQPVIADDSGLEIEALDGFPGILSARFMEDHTSKEKCLAILEKMKDITNRNAQFHCSLVIAYKGEIVHEIDAICKGSIAYSLCGENGFGYDPIFIEKETGISFAVMSSEDKNTYSHRGKASEQLKEYLMRGESK